MNVKKIISICKQTKILRLLDTDGEQWISDGYACYPLFGLPIFDEETICKAYDITEKKAASMHIMRDHVENLSLNFATIDEKEKPCSYGEALFGGSYGLIPITTDHGIEFIDGKYLLPIADSPDDMRYIFERTSANGSKYFAVKHGLILVALITPVDCINETFVERLRHIVAECEKTLAKKTEAGK